MATRVWTAATLNPPLLTLSSSSPIQPVSSRRSVPRGRLRLRSSARPRSAKFVCRRSKNAAYDDYKFPDPIPEFAEQETSKFQGAHDVAAGAGVGGGVLRRARRKSSTSGHILGTFLEHDYCGPGTFLVHQFLDMKGEIKERGLPSAPQAARAAIAWAEKNIDKDWKAWTGEY